MKNTLLWLLFLIAAVLYSLMIYSWWVEGNSNRYQQRIEQQSDDYILNYN